MIENLKIRDSVKDKKACSWFAREPNFTNALNKLETKLLRSFRTRLLHSAPPSNRRSDRHSSILYSLPKTLKQIGET